MNRKLKKFIFTTLVVLIVYNFWRALFPVPEPSSEVTIEAPPVLISEKKVEVIEKKEPVLVTNEEPKGVLEDLPPDSYQKYLAELLPLAQERDVKCSKAADEIFKDPSFIDIEDPFYKNPLNVIEGLHDVYTKTLIRSEVIDAYLFLITILKDGKYEGTKLTPSEYRNQMGMLEYYCRPEMSLRFVETVMEANKRYKFSPKMKKDIYDMSLGMLESVIGEMFTTNNLIYGLGFFKLLADNSMVPKEALDEVGPLFEKVLEHHKGFTSAWMRDKDAGDLIGQWNLLKEDQKRRAELGLEFKEIIGQMKTRYHTSI